MFGVAEVGAKTGAEFGFVEEFVGGGGVLEGVLGAEEGPIGVGGVATGQVIACFR